MKIEKQKRMKLSALTPNADNPRYIKEKDFEDLKRSITAFPEMMEARPIVVDGDTNNTILGGNMRFKAVSELGWTDVPVVVITGATEEQKREFIIKDNVQKGSWDWDALANKWDEATLIDWGMSESSFGMSDPKFEYEEEDGSGTDEDGSDNLPSADVKMVNLFFNKDQQKEFIELVGSLFEHFGVDNITDATIEIVRYAHDKIKKNPD